MVMVNEKQEIVRNGDRPTGTGTVLLSYRFLALHFFMLTYVSKPRLNHSTHSSSFSSVDTVRTESVCMLAVQVRGFRVKHKEYLQLVTV
jgi:hypothetical protein